MAWHSFSRSSTTSPANPQISRKDTYLKSLLDLEGYVDLAALASFPHLSAMTAGVDELARFLTFAPHRARLDAHQGCAASARGGSLKSHRPSSIELRISHARRICASVVVVFLSSCRRLTRRGL